MRYIKDIGSNWNFTKEDLPLEELQHVKETEMINIPHTWNNLDGQDGGLDYHRGACWYYKQLDIPEEATNKQVFIELLGANSITDIYVNGHAVAHHEGGYSCFRANITEVLNKEGSNHVCIRVDNSQNDYIYPQAADFTFFGGIYRKINLIAVSDSHFDLDYFGGNGVTVTAKVEDNQQAEILVSTYVTKAQADQKIDVTLMDADGVAIEKKTIAAKDAHVGFTLSNPRLWNGRIDPYQYSIHAQLKSEVVLDEQTVKFGIRTFHVDPDEGFFLNGKSYPLRGVSRHQDREDMGSAITEAEHKEDMELIAEVGANTIRLAHYQHDQYFYDLCDEYGMVVWAEIPLISAFMPKGYENTITQMKELIIQNYNHPSICFWGISNEISMGGEPEELQKNLRDLNDLCHKLDSTRLTTMANISMTSMESEHNHITDIVAYNHYYGWYSGTVQENGKWFDKCHKALPNRCIALSEYGAEGVLKWHNDDPKVRDYSEEYQAYYHEEMLKTFATRPFIWATYVWNMFDFAADARDEGGVKGRNNKGLVTFDRTTKKDSFYIYKAYWSKESFVHICSKRYIDRADEKVTIKVYSNCDTVVLHSKNNDAITKEGEYIFLFEDVSLDMGENTITVTGYNNGKEVSKDKIELQRVSEPNKDYIYVDEDGDGEEGADNWFVTRADGTVSVFKYPEGHFSVRDKIEDIIQTEAGKQLMISILGKTAVQGKQEELLEYLKEYTVNALLKLAAGKMSREALLDINEMLNEIEK